MIKRGLDDITGDGAVQESELDKLCRQVKGFDDQHDQIRIAADHNDDGTIDATDYAVWRNSVGTDYTMKDYQVWRANFGACS